MKLELLLKNRRRILGRNKRNLTYIRPYNLSRSKKIADDKLLTKKILKAEGIPTPETIKVIRSYADVTNINFDVLPKSFVMKPASGLEGDGIQIFYNRDKYGNWIRADKSRASVEDLKGFFADIIDGRYSLHSAKDIVILEERIKLYKGFKYYTYKGAPDVRVIVFNKVPIMAYIRFPTEASEGKANLQKGAIGAAIDIARGVTTHAIIGKGTRIEFVPHTRLRLSGIKIPYWERILRYAVEAHIVTRLGFGAFDFLIDRDKGPVLVEANARPGLSIQIANNDGAEWRLQKVRGLKVKSVEQGIRLGKDLFGGEIEEGIENITGKQVIGFVEWVRLAGKDEKQIKVKAKIDTGAESASIDRSLLHDLGLDEALEYFQTLHPPTQHISREEGLAWINEHKQKALEHPEIVDIDLIHSSTGTTIRPALKITLTLSGETFETRANAIDRSNLIYPVIIGRKSLTQFIIDPTKKFQDVKKRREAQKAKDEKETTTSNPKEESATS